MENDNLIIYWELTRTNDNGHYIEDNPDADYPNEVYVPPTKTRRIEVETIAFKDLNNAFDKEDGDYDYTDRIKMITTSNGELLWDPDSFSSRDAADVVKNILLERAEMRRRYSFL